MLDAASEILDSAADLAHRASSSARMEIESLDGVDVGEVELLISEVWGPQQNAPSNLLRGIAHAGNVLLLARSDTGQPLGFTFGYLGWAEGLHLHSHMTAVLPGKMAAGIGYALKLWQRWVCLQHGVDEIRWTYDPLIARNAHFNLVKLGAEVKEFHPNFYKGMQDRINAGDLTDRFEVAWQLRSRRAMDALNGLRPQLRPADVAIPSDFEALRSADFESATMLRSKIRNQISELTERGFKPDWGVGGYVFHQ